MVFLAACGGGATAVDRPDADVTLLLDFQANAVHAGIYTAAARGYDQAEGVRLKIRQPSSSTDATKLLLAGRADAAILDIHDLAIARAKGRDVVGVMAIVERPLAAVIARAGIRTPRALEGRRVGVTGLPSDDAVLHSIVAGAGGDPKRVRSTTIGFNAVPSLLAGKVDGATAFWSAEGVALARKRPGFHAFKVDEFGAPAYPELVLCVTRQMLRESPDTVRATVTALRRGYALTLDDPESSASDLIAREPGLDRADVTAELDALGGAFVGDQDHYGALDHPTLERWARWEARFGIVAKVPDIGPMFEPRYANAPAN